MAETLLTAEGLEKTYRSRVPFIGRDVEVLTGADISVHEAEIVGVVGENGSGKSTLMKILTGVLQQDGGTVEQQCDLGWCPQEPLLYNRLTVQETFQLFGEGYGMYKAEIQDALERLSEELGFEKYTDYRIDRLSGGNRQKVNLSVALMHDPDLLLLDEPYTGFDWQTYQRFWELSEELVDDGKAIVIISHFINERQHFDRILELRDGVLHAEE